MNITLITGCIAGVAQSKMAAKAMEKVAKEAGITIYIEEQGGHKVTQKISSEQIDASDLIIIASAVAISGKQRFKGKKIYETSVSQALLNPQKTLENALQLLKG